MRLSEYDFEVEVVKGRDNVVADALSRIQWLEGREPSNESGIEGEEFCVEYSDSEDVLGPTEEFATVELVRDTLRNPPVRWRRRFRPFDRRKSRTRSFRKCARGSELVK